MKIKKINWKAVGIETKRKDEPSSPFYGYFAPLAGEVAAELPKGALPVLGESREPLSKLKSLPQFMGEVSAKPTKGGIISKDLSYIQRLEGFIFKLA
ncbi:hypothetical protein [Mesoaciditoga lauensis]|uniref:hypothetical protein n=1 Tax=Mesoaciditoga lauensis TaxID=1495039 RepID=UPI00056B44DC|nr:hypothetical protein [Mesoaciditoga lauensis]